MMQRLLKLYFKSKSNKCFISNCPDITLSNISNKLEIFGKLNQRKIPVYGIINSYDEVVKSYPEINIDKDILVKILQVMIKLNLFDKIACDLQKKRRISFYVPSVGEEAAQVSSAAALDIDDMIFTQYREAGVGLWRGFNFEDMLNQCYCNKDDRNKGKQMPIHYVNKGLKFFSVSSTIATQMPQAVGYAYVNKLRNNRQCVICYFGEGASSAGDAHAAFNFAATLKCPIIFFCRNNGYAISTPNDQQYNGDGVAAYGQGYGMNYMKVDGNDSLAVYTATKAAREICVEQNTPTLIEALTYRNSPQNYLHIFSLRVGNHTSGDNSLAYRQLEEIKQWELFGDPILKLKMFLISKSWWTEKEDEEFRQEILKEINDTVKKVDQKCNGNPQILFEDVYDEIHPRLQRQKNSLKKFIQENKNHYPLNYEFGDNS